MARRSESKKSTEKEQNMTATAVEEPTEAPTEEPNEAPTENKAPEAEVDLSSFDAAVAEAVGDRDESTGELPAASIAKVNEVYRNLDGVKAKNRARTSIEDKMKAAINDRDIVLARSFVVLKDNLSAAGGTTAKAPADPTQAFVQKVATLQLALNLAGDNVPEGVAENYAEQVDNLVNELTPQVSEYQSFLDSDDEDAEEPDVSPVIRSAFKLARGRVSGGGGGSRVSGGPRRDIEKHLIQVFDNLNEGDFLTVNEIAKASSTEYADDRPSAGAVSARLFPKDKPAYEANGIKAVPAADGKPRGAVKVAA